MSTSFYSLSGVSVEPNPSLLERFPPEGGATGQLLAKVSAADFDFAWTTPPNYGDMFKTVYDANNDGIVDVASSAPWAGLTGVPSTLAYLTGATFTGKVNTPASVTTGAGLNIAHGTAPTSPVSGDIWTTTSSLLARINTTTQTIAFRSANTFTAKQTLMTGTTASAPLNVPHGVAPTTPANGDIWTTTAGLYAQLNGTTALMSVSGHTHTIANITSLQTTLDAKAALVHTHIIADVTGLQTALDGKAALSHTHAIADVTGLQTALDGKAALAHTHAIADVTGLQTALDSKTTTVQAAAAAPVQSVNGATGTVSLAIPTILAAPVITNPTGTTETVVARWAIPANVITANGSFKAAVRLNCAGTGTVAWKLRVGAAGTTADTLISTLTTSAAQVANAQGMAEFIVHFPTTTSAQGGGFAIMQAVVLGVVTGVQPTATIVPTGVVYVSVTATISAAAANTITAAHGLLSS